MLCFRPFTAEETRIGLQCLNLFLRVVREAVNCDPFQTVLALLGDVETVLCLCSIAVPPAARMTGTTGEKDNISR